MDGRRTDSQADRRKYKGKEPTSNTRIESQDDYSDSQSDSQSEKHKKETTNYKINQEEEMRREIAHLSPMYLVSVLM